MADEILKQNEGAEKRNVYINGYAYPFISNNVLSEWAYELSYVLCFSYGMTAEGMLIDLDDERLRSEAEQYGAGSLLVLTPLNEQGQFSNELASEVLNSENARTRLIEEVLDVITQKGMAGVDFDFEYVYAEDRQLYVQLVADTRERLAPFGYIVTAALAPKTSPFQEGSLYSGHDYVGMGASADFVLLMTYEWGYTYGPPMAVAPLDKVRQVLEYGLTEIPAQKILMGIPNYGYDWTLPFVKGESVARKLSIDEAAALAESYAAIIEFDELAQSPYFYYTDDNDYEHVVWFENEQSLKAKLSLIAEYNLAGAAYWNIMTYYSGNSNAIWSLYNVEKPALQNG